MRYGGVMRTPIMCEAGRGGGTSPVDSTRVGPVGPGRVDPSCIDKFLADDSEPGVACELPLVHADMPAWFMPARFVDPWASGFDEVGAPGAAS